MQYLTSNIQIVTANKLKHIEVSVKYRLSNMCFSSELSPVLFLQLIVCPACSRSKVQPRGSSISRLIFQEHLDGGLYVHRSEGEKVQLKLALASGRVSNQFLSQARPARVSHEMLTQLSRCLS